MQITPRAVALAAFGVGPLLLASGCGGSTPAGARSTIANIQPTSFVEIEPATTTTTSTTIVVDPASLVAGTVSPIEQIYTVKGGDSISKIAGLHNISMEQLTNYNSWTDGTSHFLGIGDQVKIPPGAMIPGTATPATETATDPGTDDPNNGTAEEAATGDGCTHTIAKDEFPNKVARQYGISVDELYAANAGGVMDTFLVGAVLNIPAGGDCG